MHPSPRATLEDTAPAQYSEGVAVVLVLDREDAEDLVVDDGLPAEELHCTVAYLGSRDDLTPAQVKAARRVVGLWTTGREPLDVYIGGIGRFAPEDSDAGDPVYLPVDCPELTRDRPALLQALRDAGVPASETHGFTPHMTVAYVAPEDDLPTDRVKGRALKFTAVELWIGPEHIRYPLDEPTETETTQMHDTLRREMTMIAESRFAPRRALPEADEAPGGEHSGMKMVFGVWRKVGTLDHADHTATGTKHAELHDKHLKKALAHGNAMYAAQKAGNHDEASRHAEAARSHHAVSIIHKDLARRHWKEGNRRDGDPEGVPEPNKATMDAARKKAQNVDTLHHNNHPDAFLTHPAAHRTAQRTGIKMT